MKKRIISMLLTVLMVMSLFSGLTVTADAANYNGANVIEYTMAQGDFVLRICQRLGLNYYTCKNAIMILNNITDGQWNKLTVGRTLRLPASDYDALLISNGAGTSVYNSGAASTTATTSNVTGTATVGNATVFNTAATVAAASSDTLAYYLVPYTMSYGETVSGVCNALGVNFSIFSPFIKQVNNISNWNRVRAGDTLIIPTPVAPSVGTTCYGVMEHIVAGSDTAYGIVSSKGVNYNANERLLKVLNQTDNLAAIKAGGKFFYPVPLTVSVPGTGNPGATSTTTTTTTVTDGNGTTTTSTTTTAKLYKLSSGMATSDGTMLFYVDNKPVTAAPAGAKVTIVTSANAGKAIQSLTVKQSDGKADFLLTADTFVMPACDVRVDASVKSGYDITIESNYSGKASASVGGVSVQAAVKGATVVVKSTDPNYEISSIYVYYRKLVSSSNKTEVKHSSSNAFVMPDMPVTIEVVLKPVATYAFYVNDPMNGSFYLKVNGSPVTRAAKGAEVTIVTNPDAGYVPGLITVTKHDDATKFVNFFNNSFTMPGYDVDINVTFYARGNNIVIMPAQGGDAVAYAASGWLSVSSVDDSEKIDERGSSEWVALEATAETGYKLDSKNPYDIVRTSDGLKVNVSTYTDSGKTYHVFRMPKGGVTVTPRFIGDTAANIYAVIKIDGTSMTTYSNASFSITVDGKKGEFQKTGDSTGVGKVLNRTLQNGESVDLRYDSSEGIAFIQYTVNVLKGGSVSTDPADKLLSEELTNAANLHGYFEMPGRDIQVVADFERGNVPIGPAVITGTGTVGYKVLDKSVTPPVWKSVNACEADDDVLLVVTPGNGYKFDSSKYESKLFITRKDNGAPVKPTYVGTGLKLNEYGFVVNDNETFGYIFKMPSSGADVRVTFDPKPFVITMKCVDQAGNDLTGLGLWQAAIDWVPGIVDNTTNINWFGFETKFDVAYGDYVTVAMTEAGWSKYDMVSFRIDDQEYTADELNFFYNFQMIDERARDHTIIAVLKPKNVGVHNLTAMFDATKGGVEFVITDSPSHYSDQFRMGSAGELKYLNKAVTGDRVAIIANSLSDKYTLKASDITITAWGTDADRIVPTEEMIMIAPGQYVRAFTFTMPDGDVNVLANFSGTQQRIMISVYNAEDNMPMSGMVRLAAVSTTGATISRDVGADVSFDDIAYNSTVTVTRSELALAERMVIQDVEIKTQNTNKSVPYTDMTNAGEGIVFTMPSEPVWVIIRMANFTYDLPTHVVYRVNNGSLVFRSGPNDTDPVKELSDFNVGDIVYVFDNPDVGYANLGLGDLKILSNGVTNIANCVKPTAVPHVWSFTMPEGTLIFQADFPLAEAQEVTLTFSIQKYDGSSVTTPFAGAEVKVTIAGNIATVENGDTIKAYEGQTMTVASDTEGFAVYRINGSGVVNGTSYTIPEDVTADAVTITLAQLTNPIVTQNIIGGTLAFTDGSGNNIATAPVGETITITPTHDTGYNDLIDINLSVVSIQTSVEVPLTPCGTTPESWSFPMPAGGVIVNAMFMANNPLITFTETNGLTFKLVMNSGLDATVVGSKAYNLAPGTKISIQPATEGYNRVEANSASMASQTGSSVTYTVPATAETVNITLSSSVKAISVDTSVVNGTPKFRKNNNSTDAAYDKSEFAAGDPVFIYAEPNSGYEFDDMKIYDINNADITPAPQTDSTGATYWEFSSLPDTGITVKPTFKAKQYNFSINLASGGVAIVNINNGGDIEIQNSNPIAVHYGDTIKVRPGSGYAWNTAPTLTPNTLDKSTSGNNVSIGVSKDIGVSGTAITLTADFKAA